jgi:hypothetical protein
VSSGIRAEGEVVFFGGGSEMVEHDSGLYARDVAGGINFEDLRHVLRKIEDDGDIAALSGEGRAAAAAEKWRAELTAERDGGLNVVGIAREHDSDGDMAVVGTVSRVESTAPAVEADFTSHLCAQSFCQRRGVNLRGIRFGGLGEFY